MNLRAAFRTFWSYAVELALAAALFAISYLTLGPDAIAAYVAKTSDEWNDLTAGLFSAAVAIWLTFVNFQSAEFGDYLKFKKREKRYIAAFQFPMLAFFVTTACLVTSKGLTSTLLSNAAFFLLLYSGAILITLIRTATQMVKAHGEFQRLVKESRDEEQRADQLPISIPLTTEKEAGKPSGA